MKLNCLTSQFQAADNREGFVMCSAHHQDDHERVCEDQGNLKDPYNNGYNNNNPENNPYTHYDTDRLTHNVGENYCGLTIRVRLEYPSKTFKTAVLAPKAKL